MKQLAHVNARHHYNKIILHIKGPQRMEPRYASTHEKILFMRRQYIKKNYEHIKLPAIYIVYVAIVN